MYSVKIKFASLQIIKQLVLFIIIVIPWKHGLLFQKTI